MGIKGGKKPADRCDPVAEAKTGCNDKQKTYIEKQLKATPEKRKSELKRLEGMQSGEMKPEAKNWLMSRVKMLKKMTAKDELRVPHLALARERFEIGRWPQIIPALRWE